MREGWEMRMIKEVAKTSAGGTPKKSHREYYEGGDIPWLQSGAVAQGEIFESKTFITKEGLDNSSAKLFPKNTVLVAMYGATAAQVGILRFEACTNQAVCGILPSKHLIPEYTFYYFLSQKSNLLAQAVGNAQPNINQAKIKETLIPVPPLDVQRRIVARLDAAFAALDQAQANVERCVELAGEVWESVLENKFSKLPGPVVKLKDLSTIISGQHIDAGNYNRSEIGIGYLTGPSDFGEKHPTITKWTPHPKKIALKDDVLVTVKGSGVGSINFMNSEELCISRQLMAIRANENNRPQYLYNFLFGKYKELQEKATGAAIPGLSRQDIGNLKIVAATSKVQDILLKELREFRLKQLAVEKNYTKNSSQITALKASVLERAFSGELV